MTSRIARSSLFTLIAGLLFGASAGCNPEMLSQVINGGAVDPTAAGIFPEGAFTQQLIQARTFIHGTAATTITHLAGDNNRQPLGIDFNGDGKVDPVIGYGESQAVIQILLSRGAPGTVDYLSLTLDSKRDMQELADIAVGDIDGDGALDIVGAAQESVWYFHHPSGRPTTDMTAWGNPDPTDGLHERIDGSYILLTEAELEAIIAQALGPGVNLDDYIVTIEQLYSNAEIGDFDNDRDNDIAASRLFKTLLTPKPEIPVEPIRIVDGDVMIFVNPGFAADGHGWPAVSIGRHERQQRLDRDGATGLLARDMDGDGDLDLVSSARDDNNVQVAWFENPGPPLDVDTMWTQWRIGSVRDAWSIDIADLSGDSRPDVVAVGGEQKQMMLFEQPAEGAKRPYDWDSFAIVNFESFEPRDVKALDMDNDGRLELAVGGTEGAVRYFKPVLDPHMTWQGFMITTYEPPGDVGLLGYGDFDRDGDLDLVAVINALDDDNNSRLTWIRNDVSVVGVVRP